LDDDTEIVVLYCPSCAAELSCRRGRANPAVAIP